MKKFKVIVSVMLCIMILFLQSVTAFAISEPDNQYNIDSAYDFPVTPEMEDEWAALSTRDDKLEACQIPDEMLKEMTTDALIETVANYPLSVNLYAFDTLEQGYQNLKEDFNGLAELEQRMKENPQVVQNKLNVETQKLVSERQYKIYANNANDDLKSYFMLRIKECLEDDSNIDSLKSSVIAGIEPNYTVSSVRTPKGSAVTAYMNCTWSEMYCTQAEAQASHNAVKSQYPSVTIISGISPRYNCHSYAWHSTSTSNNYWIDNPSKYITDGSYVEASMYVVGSKLIYKRDGEIEHSGIISGVSEKHLTYVTSKWGPTGVYKHLYYDSPYNYKGVLDYKRSVN